MICEMGSLAEGQPRAKTTRHHSNHRIACPGHVEYFAGAGAKVLRGLVSLNQGHPCLAPRYQNGIYIERGSEVVGLFNHLWLGRAATHYCLKL